MRIYKVLCYTLFPKQNWNTESRERAFNLGVDEFGRDIAKGMPKYVDILKKRGFKVHTVLVLGSRVKGHWKPESDIDVTVIAEGLPKDVNISVIRRLLGLARWFMLSDVPLFMGVEPSGCCSREEFLQKLENFDVHALDAVYYGKVIYDDGFWQQVQKKFREMEEKYDLRNTPLKQKLFVI